MAIIPHYESHAERLVEQYESRPFEEIHVDLLDLLPEAGSTILDVGAGSGRDAAWFAARGYDVVAVEPSEAMRAHARALHTSNRINWVADSLPDLAQVRRLGLTFDLILLSAVWMHVPPASRERALRKMATLLSPNGRIAISLRIGEPDPDRAMHPVTLHELSTLAQRFGLRLIRSADSLDKHGRSGITWITAVFGLPDDGIGSLPLLRHLVLVDGKSSTYKIALLRILARIADTASGTVRYEDEYVSVPMGLVSLFWMRMYKPLIEHGLPQMPASRLGNRPGFITDSFNSLRLINPVELRIGAVFEGDSAKHLQRSLMEISQLIRNMPARNLTWPASDQPIFTTVTKRRVVAPSPVRVDQPLLWSFGELHIPLEIWHALTRYNVWVEPVLVAEWIRLIEGYAGTSIPHVHQLARSLLIWVDPVRDTQLARAAVDRIRAAGKSIYCVWSGARLNDDYDIDHCFPFAAWPCGDAWNLMPASKRINIQKSNRLVTYTALQNSSDYIASWWTDAFLTISDNATQQFFLEARQTLPIIVEHPSPIDVIDAMQMHRIRLATDQGLRPWEPTPRHRSRSLEPDVRIDAF